jgi:hypothetical protein
MFRLLGVVGTLPGEILPLHATSARQLRINFSRLMTQQDVPNPFAS